MVILNKAYDIEKMYTYLRGYLVGANMQNSLKALGFARQKHEGQTRKDGTPYIVHPLCMACYAVALGIRDDNIVTTILLHDVCEDCGVELDNLPFNDTIKNAIKHVTITRFAWEEKPQTKARYFAEMLESKEAVVCKAIDRYNNLSSMAGVMSTEAIVKNIKETDELLMPILKQAKQKWPELADLLFILRTNITSINNTLKEVYCKET